MFSRGYQRVAFCASARTWHASWMASTTQLLFSRTLSHIATNERKNVAHTVLHAGRKTWHTSVVLAGSVILCSVGYVLYTDLSGKSIARQGFHQALECIQAHPSVLHLLGAPIHGYTQPTRDQAHETVTVLHQRARDPQGYTHIYLRFYLQGAHGVGEGHAELLRIPTQSSDQSAVIDTLLRWLDLTQLLGKVYARWELVRVWVDVPGEGLPSKRVIVLDRYTSMKQSKPATNIFQRMMQRQAR